MIVLQISLDPHLYRFTESMPPSTPPSHAVAVDPSTVTSPPAPPLAQSSAATVAPPPRHILLLGGRMFLSIDAFPLVGSPDATHVVAVQSDYTCEHCRELHVMLDAAQSAFRGDLALMIIPVPLERSCNPEITFPDPRHYNACAYTRLALAVWHCGRSLFTEYHHWLLAGERAPSLNEARRRATLLVDEQALQTVMGSPQIDRKIADAVSLFRQTGSGELPKLLLPTGMLWGQASSAAKLTQLLMKQLNASGGSNQPTPPPQAEVFSNRHIN
jgi:protein-disulfide isomerase